VQIVNIHQAKIPLSKLVEQAANGESFIIAKAGKPLVKVTAISTPVGSMVRCIGFLEGQFKVPDEFDRMGEDEIAAMFEGEH